MTESTLVPVANIVNDYFVWQKGDSDRENDVNPASYLEITPFVLNLSKSLP